MSAERDLARQVRDLVTEAVAQDDSAVAVLAGVLYIPEKSVRIMLTKDRWDLRLALCCADALGMRLTVKTEPDSETNGSPVATHVPTASQAADGQVWVRNSDGAAFRIVGAKARTWVLTRLRTGESIEVPRDELADEWEFLGCDHEAACCTIHGTHTMPHMGCILR